MNMSELKCNLLPNKYHQQGDTKPCLKNHAESQLEITEPGTYNVAIWAPKPGKKAYFMLLEKVDGNNGGCNHSSTSANNPPPQNGSTVKPIFDDSLFK